MSVSFKLSGFIAVAWTTIATVVAGSAGTLNAQQLEIKSSIYLHSGTVHALALRGTTLYALSETGLQVYSFNGTTLRLIGNTTERRFTHGRLEIAPDRTAAYAVDGDRMAIYDIRVPEHPRLVADTALEGSPTDARARGSLLYIASPQTAEILVYDISSPLTPAYVTRSRTANEAMRQPQLLAFHGTYLYASGNDGHLLIWNVTNPKSPVYVAENRNSGGGHPVDNIITDDWLFELDNEGILRTYSLATPAFPVLVARERSVGAVAYGCVIIGSKIFTVSTEMMESFDATDPVSGMPLIQRHSCGACTVTAVVTDGTNLIAAHNNVIEVYNQQYGRVDGIAGYRGYAHSVVTAGSYAYLADGEGGVKVFDIHSGAAPIPLYAIETERSADIVAIDSNRLYVGEGGAGVFIYELRDSLPPLQLGNFRSLYRTTEEWVTAFTVQGHMLFAATYTPYVDPYVQGGRMGVQAIDVSNPAAPVQRTFYSTEGRPVAMGAVDGIGCIAELNYYFNPVQGVKQVEYLRLGGDGSISRMMILRGEIGDDRPVAVLFIDSSLQVIQTVGGSGTSYIPPGRSGYYFVRNPLDTHTRSITGRFDIGPGNIYHYGDTLVLCVADSLMLFSPIDSAFGIPTGGGRSNEIPLGTSFNDDVLAVADRNFFTVMGLAPPHVQLSGPDVRVALHGCDTLDLSWKGRNVTSVSIAYSIDNGATWRSLADSLSGLTGHFAWRFPNAPATGVLIRLCGSGACDTVGPLRADPVPQSLDVEPADTMHAKPRGTVAFDIHLRSCDIDAGDPISIINPIAPSRTILQVDSSGAFHYAYTLPDSDTIPDSTLPHVYAFVFATTRTDLPSVFETRYVRIGKVGMVQRDDPVRLSIQIKPNPLHRGRILGLDLPVNGNVRVTLVNDRGATSTTLFDGYLTSGAHEIPIDDTALPTGTYRCRVETGAGNAVLGVIISQ